MQELKQMVNNFSVKNEDTLHSLGSALEHLQQLKDSFSQMRKQTDVLKQTHTGLCENVQMVEQKWMKSVNFWSVKYLSFAVLNDSK